MQSDAKARQAHDNDILLASNASAFKQWLITQQVKVSEPDRKKAANGVLFWVEMPDCKPVSVQEGFGRQSRYAQTHYKLRPLLNSFLTSPMASAIKEVVRPAAIQRVVAGKVQPTKAANSNVPALLQSRGTGSYLLSEEDIKRALAIQSPIPVGAAVKHVFGVRVTAGVGSGPTVAAHMKVYDHQGLRHVEVVDYPICSDGDDLRHMAQKLFATATDCSNAVILVDSSGMGAQFLRLLESMVSTTVEQYAVQQGKRSSEKRYLNQRAECTVLAAQAIRSGAIKLACPSQLLTAADLIDRLGARIPFVFDDLGRYKIIPKEVMRNEGLPCPDLFETISMAFLSDVLPIEAEKPVAPKAATKPLDQYLADLRDDFAVTCPLKQKPEETLAAFAIRRWAYAQAMVDARPR